MRDDPSDDRLEDRLRRLAAQREPVPPELVQAAVDAFGWRDIDADLAQLVFDSLASADDAALVRSGPGRRLVTFEAGDLTVDLEVTGSGGERSVMGQIAPPQAAGVDIRRQQGTVTVTADELGRFQAGPLPAGPVSVRVRPAGAPPGQAVVTDWVSL
jgi:hypothetical protein